MWTVPGIPVPARRRAWPGEGFTRPNPRGITTTSRLSITRSEFFYVILSKVIVRQFDVIFQCAKCSMLILAPAIFNECNSDMPTPVTNMFCYRNTSSTVSSARSASSDVIGSASSWCLPPVDCRKICYRYVQAYLSISLTTSPGRANL